MVDRVLEWVAGLGALPLYAATAGLAMGETALLADLVVPGEVGLVVAGAGGSRGDARLPILVLSGAVGATLGDTVSYLVGRRWGLEVLSRWDRLWRMVEPRIERARDHFARRGGVSVFAGRFVGALRAIVPAVAGTAGLSFPRFLAWNLTASFAWAGAVISLGWFLGDGVADLVDRAGTLLSVAVVTIVLAAWGYHRLRRDRRSGSGPGSP